MKALLSRLTSPHDSPRATAHFAPPILTSGLPYCVPRRGGEARARVWDDLFV